LCNVSVFTLNPPASRAGIKNFYRFQIFFVGERAERLPLLASMVSQKYEYDTLSLESPFITLYCFLLYFFVSLKKLQEKE
jgi:hypothetical protein